jgi:hypothetical protein
MSVATLTPPLEHRSDCSCPPCRVYRSRRQTRWRERKQRGEVFWVDADPVRIHLRTLMATYRMPINAIAAQTNVAEGTIFRLLYDHKNPPMRLVADIGERLRGARFDLDFINGNAVIEPTGTRRRLHGLAAAGYDIAALASELNRTPRALRRVLASPTVRVDIAREIRDLADRLEAIPPPGDSDLVAATQADAKRHGWMRLAAWDDIDDPAAAPSIPERPDTEPDPAAIEEILLGGKSPHRRREVDLYGVVLHLRQRGKGASVLAKLLGCSGSRAAQLVERAALYELMRRLDSEGRLELRFLKHLDSGAVHIVQPVDPDDEGDDVSFAEGLAALALEPILTVCGYRGRPDARSGAGAVDQFVDCFPDKKLCGNCHRALRLLAPRAFEHPQPPEVTQ